jgi:putative phosphonate transport system ATP-binding protein
MLLKAENINKIYGNSCGKCLLNTGVKHGTSICPFCNSVVAVRNISFTLSKNQVLGIVGESGSGKSTLLKILHLIERPDSGSLYINEPESLKDKDIFSLNLLEQNFYKNIATSIVHQKINYGLNFNFSAGANVAERIITGGDRKFYSINSKVINLLKQTDIPVERANDLPENFSGGQQQRIQISKALANSPNILFLDEPTTGLDVSIQAKIIDLIKKLKEKFKFSIILVSHDLNVIKHLTDITFVMKNGEIVERGLTDQILNDPQHEYTQLLVSSIL